ncbi:hypothetical protein CDAR_19621 [Caerostris darwini]|uniref:Uncharacterized protein n=1 Tax=Caerostris darwini TaxID=1538125 RepID=A0AAV4V5Y9_9ARAC|nr:hypothetical protein CDAR_19621 [Caerostris darwini]
MTTAMTLTTVPMITKEALHCQRILQAEKDVLAQKTRYEAALGFVNIANIVCDQNLLNKVTTSKLTKDALQDPRYSDSGITAISPAEKAELIADCWSAINVITITN